MRPCEHCPVIRALLEAQAETLAAVEMRLVGIETRLEISVPARPTYKVASDRDRALLERYLTSDPSSLTLEQLAREEGCSVSALRAALNRAERESGQAGAIAGRIREGRRATAQQRVAARLNGVAI